MRTLVCSQCHVEYYFKPTGKKVKVMGETIVDDSSKNGGMELRKIMMSMSFGEMVIKLKRLKPMV